MNERLMQTPPTPEVVPSAAEQLFAHFSSSREVSKGVVQTMIENTNNYIDSPVLSLKMVGKELVFKTTSPDGTGNEIIVRSIEGSSENFVILDRDWNPTDVILKMSFPGFTPQTPSPEVATDGAE